MLYLGNVVDVIGDPDLHRTYLIIQIFYLIMILYIKLHNSGFLIITSFTRSKPFHLARKLLDWTDKYPVYENYGSDKYEDRTYHGTEYHIGKCKPSLIYDILHVYIASDMTDHISVFIEYRCISGAEPAPVSVIDHGFYNIRRIDSRKLGFTQLVITCLIDGNVIRVQKIHIAFAVFISPDYEIEIFYIRHVFDVVYHLVPFFLILIPEAFTLKIIYDLQLALFLCGLLSYLLILFGLRHLSQLFQKFHIHLSRIILRCIHGEPHKVIINLTRIYLVIEHTNSDRNNQNRCYGKYIHLFSYAEFLHR